MLARQLYGFSGKGLGCRICTIVTLPLKPCERRAQKIRLASFEGFKG